MRSQAKSMRIGQQKQHVHFKTCLFRQAAKIKMTGWIGISLGDVTGIGPEVTLKALAIEAQAGNTRYLLIGDAEHTHRLNEQLGLRLPLQPYAGKDDPGRFFLCQPLSDPLPADLMDGSP